MKFFTLGFVACLLACLLPSTVLFASDCPSATALSLGSCQTVAFDSNCDFGPAGQIACTTPACQGDVWFQYIPGGSSASQFNVQFDVSVDVSNTINIVWIYSESKDLTSNDPCEWPSGAQGYTRYGSLCTEVVSPGIPVDFTVSGIDGSGTFYLLVERVTGTGGDVTVCPTLLSNCPAPTNDRCSSPISLTASNGIDPNAAVGPGIPNWNDALKATNACATKQRLTDFCSAFSAGDPTEDHYTRKIGPVCYHNGSLGDDPLFPVGTHCNAYLENTVYYTFQVPVTANDWFVHIGSTSQCPQEPNNISVMLFEDIDCADARNANLIACTKTPILGAIPSSDWSYPSSGTGMTLTAGQIYWIVIDGTRQSQCDFCILLGRGPANPVLPVEFLSFEGRAEETGHLLEWTTRTEDGISSFEIQRSSDAEEFASIGTTLSTGSIEQGETYSFLDEDAPIGSSYYRIKTLDINGVESLSETIHLTRSLEGPQLFRLFPNPAKDRLHLFMGIPEQTGASFELVDMWGRTVYRESQLLGTGNQEHALSVGHLARGLYVLRIQIGRRSFTRKVLLN